jgi:hypothetical protein
MLFYPFKILFPVIFIILLYQTAAANAVSIINTKDLQGRNLHHSPSWPA